MTLTEIAAGILEHLKRFSADEAIAHYQWTDNSGGTRTGTAYFMPMAWRAGNRCKIRYVAYQHENSLTKLEAEAYLSWLAAGNIGKHYKVGRND